MLCTEMGASPPTGTVPTIIFRDLRRCMGVSTCIVNSLSYSPTDTVIKRVEAGTSNSYAVPFNDNCTACALPILTSNGACPCKFNSRPGWIKSVTSTSPWASVTTSQHSSVKVSSSRSKGAGCVVSLGGSSTDSASAISSDCMSVEPGSSDSSDSAGSSGAALGSTTGAETELAVKVRSEERRVGKECGSAGSAWGEHDES